MSTEERRAYLETTLRKAPEGSARRIWAAAQLAALSKPDEGGRPTKDERGRTKR